MVISHPSGACDGLPASGPRRFWQDFRAILRRDPFARKMGAKSQLMPNPRLDRQINGTLPRPQQNLDPSHFLRNTGVPIGFLKDQLAGYPCLKGWEKYMVPYHPIILCHMLRLSRHVSAPVRGDRELLAAKEDIAEVVLACCEVALHPMGNVCRSLPLSRDGIKWPRGISYGSILGWMNIHLPPILMFTRGTGF